MRKEFDRRDALKVLMGGVAAAVGAGAGAKRLQAQKVVWHPEWMDWRILDAAITQNAGPAYQLSRRATNADGLEARDVYFNSYMGVFQQLRAAGLDNVMNFARENPGAIGYGDVGPAMRRLAGGYNRALGDTMQNMMNESIGQEQWVFDAIFSRAEDYDDLHSGVSGALMRFWQMEDPNALPPEAMSPEQVAYAISVDIYESEPRCLLRRWWDCDPFFPPYFPGPEYFPEPPPFIVGVDIPWFDPFSRWTAAPFKTMTKGDLCWYLGLGMLYITIILRVLTTPGGAIAVAAFGVEIASILFALMIIIGSVKLIFC